MLELPLPETLQDHEFIRGELLQLLGLMSRLLDLLEHGFLFLGGGVVHDFDGEVDASEGAFLDSLVILVGVGGALDDCEV